ncbi:MAG: sigma-54-dependent Fis family transcriptional regulator [Sedimentisphaerales bacterium]|nr:sigma-54-dependent Fis family transcriptional regulator [Sedimentisphaerales bacterium]
MIKNANILVIDDEESMRDSCLQTLSRKGYNVETAGNGIKGLEMLKEKSYDLVILDLKMPGLNGLEVLKIIKQDNPDIVVVVITGHATVESAVEAMKQGAYDFIPKPFTPESLRMIVQRALSTRELALENLLLRTELKLGLGQEVIIGSEDSMKSVEQLVRKVGPTDTTVLITGESGTGKEVIARAIHRCSSRNDKSFVAVDCSSLVESLFESELFGHVKGSFTGAVETKYGRFELANGGTLFFDEIGNVSLSIQSKLLRVLQEREIIKVGSSQVVKVDVRIIAATNKDLVQSVKDGTFREDLFYRLSVVPITIPPLRERKGDIPLLTKHFLEKYNKKRGKNIKGISDEAMHALVEYDWPGNVRELENAIERAVVLTEHETIEPADLLYYGLTIDPVSEIQGNSEDKVRRLVDMEKEHIIKALKQFNGHRGNTAESLGIDRKTLRLKMKAYGIE